MRYTVTVTPPSPASPFDAFASDSLPDAASYTEAVRLRPGYTASLVHTSSGCSVSVAEVRRAREDQARVGLTDLGRFAARRAA